MSFLKSYPGADELLKSYDPERSGFPLKVNNHIHTPFSFSAFSSIEEAVKMAASEEVRILGINDFYVTDGYPDFIEMCRKHGVFPLLNIELIGISKEEQEAGIRVNDPGNPGRTYISGKGLAYPSILPEKQQEKLDRVVAESNHQVAKMIALLNRWLAAQETHLSLSVDEIMEHDAMQLLRERHVAKSLRQKIRLAAGSEEEFASLISKVYGGKSSDKNWNDFAGLEEELRARLLKAGAPAFVPEDEKAFLPLEEIIRLIRDAGGIPTYPMLLDGTGGAITTFESGKEQLAENLAGRGFKSVELIPLRNKAEILKDYAEFFYTKGFMVSFGTEHNTTAMRPVTVDCNQGVALDDSLLNISFNGAACLAAHQYLVSRDQHSDAYSRDQLEQLGHAVIFHFFNP
ncbi:MAG: PHP domain-containing protein [Bacteroidales bacterium]